MKASTERLASGWMRSLEIIILIVAIAISASLVFRSPGVVPGAPMDQHFVQTVDLHLRHNGSNWVFQYPNLQYAGGITSSLAAGLYKLIIPTTQETLNWHFRCFAMAAMLISSFYLLQTALPRHPALRITAFLLIATSGFQLLEPSSEVIATTYLNLFLIAALKPWPKALTGFFLALYGLGKVELTLGAAALCLLWFLWEQRKGNRQAIQCLIFPALWAALLILPALLLQGANPFAGSRSTVAFMSSYSGFLKFHQFQSTIPSNGEAIKATQEIVFSRAKTFGDVVLQYPRLYLDYVGISAARSIPNIASVFKFMLLPIALVFLRWQKVRQNRFLLFAAGIAALCILLPSWLVIFVRMRYIAKVLPAMTAATMAVALETSQTNRSILRITWFCSLLTLLWQCLALSGYQD